MDGIELHACHGFFLDEFLWSETNMREDRYGGATICERATYPAEVVAAIRQAVGPDFLLCFRFSQWKEVAYEARIVESPDELGRLLEMLEKAGVDLLHPSTRRFFDPAFSGSDLGLAGWCKQFSDLPVITVGSVGLATDVMNALIGTIDDGLGLEANLAELLRRFERGDFDLVAVGRSLIADPDWPRKIRGNAFPDIRPFIKDDLGQALEMEPQMIKDVHHAREQES